MGRKSSAKSQAKPASAGAPPPDAPRGFNPLLVVAIVAVVAVIGLFAYSRSGAAPEAATAAAGETPAKPPQQAAAPVSEAAKRGPHKQDNLPPLPFNPAPPARPADVVRAVYRFAAEHPEVLAYMPCYCGCERSGHRGNEDCFVTARDAKMDVTEWEPHGAT